VAQIIVDRHARGAVGLGLFLVATGAFAYRVLDPVFGPIAFGCISGGAAVALLLFRRCHVIPHIDPRQADASDRPPPPIEPR